MKVDEEASGWEPVPILMYHDIELAPRDKKYKHFYVLASDFDWQMRSLRRAGYTPITFEQLQNSLSGLVPLPKKPIILTFDDGYRNVLRYAHPVLSREKYPYTVFVVSGKVGGTNDWVSAEGYETSSLMDWDEIREIKASGLADIQAHTVTHRKLTDLTDEEIDVELKSSKDAIEEHLNHSIQTICYPYGAHDHKVVDIARSAGYSYGVTTDFGRVRKRDNPLRLPRISIHYVPPFSFDYGIASMNYWWKIKTRKDRRG